MRKKTDDPNMNPILKRIFSVLIREDGYSWLGLASLFTEIYGEEDIHEFISCLQYENETRDSI